MPKKKLIYKGHGLDSKEELMFFKWAEEARELGLIESFEVHSETLTLCSPFPVDVPVYKYYKRQPFIKKLTKTVNLTGKIVYTPDFKICVSKEMHLYYPGLFLCDISTPLFIDIKGSYNGGQNNVSGSTFPIKAAWSLMSYGVFIQKIKPKTLFKQTWVPEGCRYTPVRKDLVKEFTKTGYKTMKQSQEYRDSIDNVIAKRSEAGYDDFTYNLEKNYGTTRNG